MFFNQCAPDIFELKTANSLLIRPCTRTNPYLNILIIAQTNQRLFRNLTHISIDILRQLVVEKMSATFRNIDNLSRVKNYWTLRFPRPLQLNILILLFIANRTIMCMYTVSQMFNKTGHTGRPTYAYSNSCQTLLIYLVSRRSRRL